VGGTFTSAGGQPANRIAKWDGTNWWALGSGFISTITALAVNGTNLYAGGNFTSAVALRQIVSPNGMAQPGRR
jgi:hypothetical protein